MPIQVHKLDLSVDPGDEDSVRQMLKQYDMTLEGHCNCPPPEHGHRRRCVCAHVPDDDKQS